MQYNTNHYPGMGMIGEDPLTPGVRPQTTNWLSNEPLAPISNGPTPGSVPPLAAPPLRPIAPPIMHNMLAHSNSNDFLQRNDPFANSSPPLTDFKRMNDIGIQTSDDVNSS